MQIPKTHQVYSLHSSVPARVSSDAVLERSGLVVIKIHLAMRNRRDFIESFPPITLSRFSSQSCPAYLPRDLCTSPPPQKGELLRVPEDDAKGGGKADGRFSTCKKES